MFKKHQEKEYEVGLFEEILKLLNKMGQRSREKSYNSLLYEGLVHSTSATSSHLFRVLIKLLQDVKLLHTAIKLRVMYKY